MRITTSALALVDHVRGRTCSAKLARMSMSDELCQTASSKSSHDSPDAYYRMATGMKLLLFVVFASRRGSRDARCPAVAKRPLDRRKVVARLALRLRLPIIPMGTSLTFTCSASPLLKQPRRLGLALFYRLTPERRSCYDAKWELVRWFIWRAASSSFDKKSRDQNSPYAFATHTVTATKIGRKAFTV